MWSRGFFVVAFASAALVLAGCKITFTHRIDVQPDESANIHVIVTMDDQFYQLSQAQTGKDAVFLGGIEGAKGWTVRRTVTNAGDHVADASTHVATVADIASAFSTYYASAAPSGSSPSSIHVTGFSPSTWNFHVDRTQGIFTDTIHVHADAPALIPDTPGDSANPAASLGASVISSMVTVNTEIKLPGSIKTTNGEKMQDGSIRFQHSLSSPTTIDVVGEVPDYTHIVISALLAVVLLVVLVTQRRARPSGSRTTTAPHDRVPKR
jgi:hypothetical protein